MKVIRPTSFLFERFRGGFRSAERGEQMNLGSCSQGPGRCGQTGKTAAGVFLVLMAVMASGGLLMRSSLSAQESVAVSEVADSCLLYTSDAADEL